MTREKSSPAATDQLKSRGGRKLTPAAMNATAAATNHRIAVSRVPEVWSVIVSRSNIATEFDSAFESV
jgi:hypothetical protein